MADLQLPAHLFRRQTTGLADTLAANLSGGAVPYLSIKGSRFNLVDATGNQKPVGQFDQDTGSMYLDCVVVDANSHISKIYYEGAYDPNAETYLPPTCFSDNGVAPSSQAQKPQSKTCASCPNNVWGSDTSRLSGKATKACNDVQKLAVAIPGMEMVFLLRVPPASLKRLGKYVREVGSFSSGERKVDVTDLVTRISFEKDAIGVLNFEPMSWIDEPTMEFCEKVRGKGTDMIVGKLDRPYTGETVALAPARESAGAERSLPPPNPAPYGEGGTGRGAAASGIPTRAAPAIDGNGQMTEATKPRGRPRGKKPVEAAPTHAPFVHGVPRTPTPDEIEDIPDFLKRPQTLTGSGGTGVGSPVAVSGSPAEQKFGMVSSAPAPDEEMRKKIAAAMGLPT